MVIGSQRAAPVHAADDGIACEPLRDIGALEAIRGEWQRLFDRCPQATPFQSPDWAIAWWRHYGEGVLLSWAIRAAGRLVGVAPLYIRERRVLLVGNGNSDYLDLLCERAWAGRAIDRLFPLLQAHGGLWDACEFQQLAAGSPLLGAALPVGWREETVVQEHCPVLDLSQPATSAEMRRRAQADRRRLEKMGRVDVERATAGNFDEIFAALVALHRARWAARGLPGVLDMARDQAFHRAAAAGLLCRGLLRLYGLRVDGRIVAALHAFHAHGRTCFYLGGFDPRFARFSPGGQILAHAVEQAIAEGAAAFDFLRGREPYKYRWGAVDRDTFLRRMRAP